MGATDGVRDLNTAFICNCQGIMKVLGIVRQIHVQQTETSIKRTK